LARAKLQIIRLTQEKIVGKKMKNVILHGLNSSTPVLNTNTMNTQNIQKIYEIALVCNVPLGIVPFLLPASVTLAETILGTLVDKYILNKIAQIYIITCCMNFKAKCINYVQI
jgi:hypothetical protein